jgi:hypothetical protein
MFAPEQIYKKCPWWHKLFKCWRCRPIRFKGVMLPYVSYLPEFPKLDLHDIVDVQPLDHRTGVVFYPGIEKKAK